MRLAWTSARRAQTLKLTSSTQMTAAVGSVVVVVVVVVVVLLCKSAAGPGRVGGRTMTGRERGALPPPHQRRMTDASILIEISSITTATMQRRRASADPCTNDHSPSPLNVLPAGVGSVGRWTFPVLCPTCS